MRPVLIAVEQAAAAALGAALAYSYLGEHAATAAWFGGLVAVANTLMLAWRMRGAMRYAGKSPGQELARLVRSSMERFFMVALLVAAGLGWLKLMPAPLLLGFVLGQLVLVASTVISGIEKQ
ncbi:MAG: ATP synthase subunit I [Sulfuricella sp.]|jgi:ATP synthase protein I|nr:ATP synthase subunit I [Sulfuricella sp.]